MEALDLLSATQGGSQGGSGIFGSLVSSLGLTMSLYSALYIFGYVVAITMVGLVLYYFTGSEKKADKFFPHLMSQSFRVFTYVWMFLSSITAFVGLATILFWVFDNILPDAKGFLASSDDSEWDVLLKGVLVLIFSLMLIGVKYIMNRMVVKTSKIGSTVSTKIFVTFGMVLFSILFFVSGLSFLLNFVDYAKEADAGLDPFAWSIFFASMAILTAYLAKGWMVLREESK